MRSMVSQESHPGSTNDPFAMRSTSHPCTRRSGRTSARASMPPRPRGWSTRHPSMPALQALLHFPEIPGVYVCHDATNPVDTPPRFPRILRHVAVDENCKERIVRAGVPPGQVPVIYNSVDLSRFRPRDPLPAQPTRALLFSNYAKEGTHLGPVRAACARAGLALDVIGSEVGNLSAAPETIIGQYDLVFAKARCALEAMAVGAAVILCDFRRAGARGVSAALRVLRP